jgi:hypothetical protein
MLDMINETSLEHEAAILTKNGVYSVIALSVAPSCGLIVLGRSDIRTDAIHNSHQKDRETGQTNFENSLKHSVDNGWRIVWRGFPYGKPELKPQRRGDGEKKNG